MRNQMVLIFTCLTLVGCASQDARILRDQKCSNPSQCTIKVLNPTCVGSTCTASVDFDRTIFERGKNNFKVTWELPAGFGFCDTTGDGVWLKKVDPYGQFEDPTPAKPGGSGLCIFREFQLKAKNTKSLPREPYEYKIFFHDEAGARLYVVDPYMLNE